jgi:uncharacterized protein (TIGR03083 family)
VTQTSGSSGPSVAETAPSPTAAHPRETRLAPDEYLRLLRTDGLRLADVAGQDLEADVPTCPGWTVADVVLHTAEVYQHKLACMRLGRSPGDEYPGAPPAHVDALSWFSASLRELLHELRERGPSAASFTWFPPEQTTGFWYRRMAHETAVHRVDVESAAGTVTAVDRRLALDGIDEILRVILSDPDVATVTNNSRGSVAVRTGEHVWTIELGPGLVDARPRLGAADATITGEPSELLLWLWGRRPDSAVQISGDDSLVPALIERLRLATV